MPSLEIRVFNVLLASETDKDLVIKYLKELTKAKLSSSIDMAKYDIGVVDARVMYGDEHKYLDKLSEENFNGKSLELVPLSLFERGKDSEENYINIILTGQMDYKRYGKAVDEKWGYRPFVKKISKMAIWHQALHELGVKYSHNNGNCRNPNCLMSSYGDDSYRICEACSGMLERKLELYEKIGKLRKIDVDKKTMSAIKTYMRKDK